MSVKSIILVHGAWADGSSWAEVIPFLADSGAAVTAIQMPLTSFADDVATLRRAIALAEAPILLVGHSYGGAVITEAGGDEKVFGLVYIAAFAPDAGESAGSLGETVAPPPIAAELRPDSHGFLKLTERGIRTGFAQDVGEAAQTILFAAQAPTSVESLEGTVSVPAWRSKPSWYLIAGSDRAIQPALERTMAARMDARTTEVAASSHVAMISHPDATANLILDAVGASKAASLTI